MDYYLEEQVNLKEAINIQDLRDPNKGAIFEVDETSGQPESEVSNSVFPGEDVYANILRVDEKTLETCDREGLDTFEVMQRAMEDITEMQDGGVYKRVVKPGTGQVVPFGSLVIIHYNAYHDMEAEPFDSTRLRHKTDKFRLGIGNQVEGLHVAVGSMKKGERSHFLFKPEYFYGKLGCPPRIPPNCTVLFDIELISFVVREGVEDYYQMTEEERKNASFEFVCKVAKSEREEGNQFFNGSMYGKALTKYRQAGRILEDYHLKNEREEDQQKKLLVRVYINAALCCSKLNENGQSITFCNKALALDPANVKAIYHKAKALHSQSEFEEAGRLYLKAQRLDSTNRDIAKALRKLDQDMKKFALQLKDHREMCQRMMSASLEDPSKTEEMTQKAKEEEEEKCSDRFRATVEEKIEEFSKSPDLTEMPFPEQSLTVPEIACIVEVAENFGMIVQRRGTGNAARMMIMKTKEQLNFNQ